MSAIKHTVPVSAVFDAAHRAAWAAVDSSGSERVQNLPAVALVEAKELMVHAALLALAEHLEELGAPESVEQIHSLVVLLRDTPPARAPQAESWALRHPGRNVVLR